MNLSEIETLAKLVKANDLTALEVSEGAIRIRLERERPKDATASPVQMDTKAQTPAPMPSAPEAALGSGLDFNRLTEVKSPLVGVFYASPQPGADPFVRIGDSVHKGDVLCVVEAMKLMNEITCETDGEIVDICAQDGQIVEYGQTLFKIY